MVDIFDDLVCLISNQSSAFSAAVIGCVPWTDNIYWHLQATLSATLADDRAPVDSERQPLLHAQPHAADAGSHR